MGRMKEYYLNNLDWEHEHINPPPIEEPMFCSDQSPTITCPNCFQGQIDMNYTKKEGVCKSCGQEFVLVDSRAVRFK